MLRGFSFRAVWSVGGVFLLVLSVPPCARGGEITQHFPADEPAAKMRTQWRVVWGIENHAGGSEVLFVKEAHFKRSAADPEIKVLGDCRLAEIFVPYNNGCHVYDIAGNQFPLVDLDRNALGPSCVARGKIYKRDGKVGDTGPVVKEVHDGHIRWMNGEETIRRGQNMAIWSVLKGANYRYIILYEFRDDGVIGLRLGATGHNLYIDDTDTATHLHLGCWRINLELGDASQTTVSSVRLDTAKGKTVVEDLTRETRLKWVAEDFTRLRVTSTVAKNAHNPPHPIGYELIPVRMGSGRSRGCDEEFTLHDLWVTRARPNELRPYDLGTFENDEALGHNAVTIWHHSPVLHIPRDEDFGVNGPNPYEGSAITAWAGCDLKPRNFFPSTPLYP
jgi:hypothetical protein